MRTPTPWWDPMNQNPCSPWRSVRTSVLCGAPSRLSCPIGSVRSGTLSSVGLCKSGPPCLVGSSSVGTPVPHGAQEDLILEPSWLGHPFLGTPLRQDPHPVQLRSQRIPFLQKPNLRPHKVNRNCCPANPTALKTLRMRGTLRTRDPIPTPGDPALSILALRASPARWGARAPLRAPGLQRVGP